MDHESGTWADPYGFLDQHRAHAIIVLDGRGRVIEWRAGAEMIFGWQAKEIHGEPLDRLFTPEDCANGAPRQEIEIATTTGEAPDDRWQMRKDGSRLWAEGMLSALRNADGQVTGFVKVLRNRTESRGETMLLENQIRELEEADDRKDIFLATLVHELRGPLTPLANAMTIIQSKATHHPDLAFPSRIISRQIALLSSLVGDLTELVRVGSGKMELAREVLDLNHAVRIAVESRLAQVRARGQHIETLVPHVPTRVSADPGRIQQVLVNLITNASKYTPSGGNIWVTVTVEGNEAVIRVRDDGIGIRPEMQTRIFELFTQVASGKHMSQGGLGLGLPLVRELVQLHGGSVQVHSEGEKRGSEFVVKLPLHPR